jgi:hypothetical protein
VARRSVASTIPAGPNQQTSIAFDGTHIWAANPNPSGNRDKWHGDDAPNLVTSAQHRRQAAQKIIPAWGRPPRGSRDRMSVPDVNINTSET